MKVNLLIARFCLAILELVHLGRMTLTCLTGISVVIYPSLGGGGDWSIDLPETTLYTFPVTSSRKLAHHPTDPHFKAILRWHFIFYQQNPVL